MNTDIILAINNVFVDLVGPKGKPTAVGIYFY